VLDSQEEEFRRLDVWYSVNSNRSTTGFTCVSWQTATACSSSIKAVPPLQDCAVRCNAAVNSVHCRSHLSMRKTERLGLGSGQGNADWMGAAVQGNLKRETVSSACGLSSEIKAIQVHMSYRFLSSSERRVPILPILSHHFSLTLFIAWKAMS
jgi:hypothetical protein